MKVAALAILLTTPALADEALFAPCLMAHADADSLLNAIVADGWTEVTQGTAYASALKAESEVAWLFMSLPRSLSTRQEADAYLQLAHRRAEQNEGFIRAYALEGYSLTLTGPERAVIATYRCTITAERFPNWDLYFTDAIAFPTTSALPSIFQLSYFETAAQPGTLTSPIRLFLMEMTYPEGTTEPFYATSAMTMVSALTQGES